MVVAASCYEYACHRQGLGSCLSIQIHGLELSTDKILEENLVQSAFQQTWRQIHLSAGQKPKTQDDIKYSRVA